MGYVGVVMWVSPTLPVPCDSWWLPHTWEFTQHSGTVVLYAEAVPLCCEFKQEWFFSCCVSDDSLTREPQFRRSSTEGSQPPLCPLRVWGAASSWHSDSCLVGPALSWVSRLADESAGQAFTAGVFCFIFPHPFLPNSPSLRFRLLWSVGIPASRCGVFWRSHPWAPGVRNSCVWCLWPPLSCVPGTVSVWHWQHGCVWAALADLTSCSHPTESHTAVSCCLPTFAKTWKWPRPASAGAPAWAASFRSRWPWTCTTWPTPWSWWTTWAARRRPSSATSVLWAAIPSSWTGTCRAAPTTDSPSSSAAAARGSSALRPGTEGTQRPTRGCCCAAGAAAGRRKRWWAGDGLRLRAPLTGSCRFQEGPSLVVSFFFFYWNICISL